VWLLFTDFLYLASLNLRFIIKRQITLGFNTFDISAGFTNGSDANDVTDSENDEDDDEKPNKADEDEEDRSESPPKPKRKRGRPPKVPKVEEKPPKERWVIFYFSVFFLACFLSRVFSISPRFYLVPPLKCHFLFFCSTENNRKT